uniref:Uncharacterized protein n=1 Tax=Arundo donax TaxID=35708 RepID=A0A0A9A1Q6_ARUDO
MDMGPVQLPLLQSGCPRIGKSTSSVVDCCFSLTDQGSFV